jgi:hypothetical protein
VTQNSSPLLHFDYSQPSEDQLVLKLGSHEIGIVWLHADHSGEQWFWRLWLGTPLDAQQGWRPNEAAAKETLLQRADDWLQRAGIGKWVYT